MGSGPPEPRPSTATERKKLVAEYEQTLKSAKEQHKMATAETERRRKLRRPLILFFALAITLYLTLFPPAWLEPAPIPPPSPAELEANDRFAIYLQAQRIEHFRNTRGRLPSTLEEAGEPIAGLRFELLDDGRYAITSGRNEAVRYTSSDSLGRFLGGSMQLLGGNR